MSSKYEERIREINTSIALLMNYKFDLTDGHMTLGGAREVGEHADTIIRQLKEYKILLAGLER